MTTHDNLENKIFDNWTVLNRTENINTYIKTYLCRCVCGEVRIVRACHLISGSSKSCGCTKPPTKHGQATTDNFTKKYKTWRYVKARCTQESNKSYDRYKGKLCEEWMEFENFNRDVPEPESDDLTIDRKDNNKGYEPGNVRWVTFADQHRNQSNCVFVEYNGKTQLLADWAREFNVGYNTFYNRFKRFNGDIDKVIEIIKTSKELKHD